MPNPIYAWYTGENQGEMDGWGSWPGEDDQEGREGSCLIQKFEHEITIPRDPQSGLASGRRVHKPVCVTQRINKASPMLYQALCSGERFRSDLPVVPHRPDRRRRSGQLLHHHARGGGARLDERLVPITADQSKADYSHFQDLCFTYRKIIWTWEDGGVETEDDWKKG